MIPKPLMVGATRGMLLLASYALVFMAGRVYATHLGWDGTVLAALLVAVAGALLVGRAALTGPTGTTAEAMRGLLELAREMEARE